MADRYLAGVEVRPIRPGERARFDEALCEHHWLGSRLVGETMRYVALGPEGTWVALVGFGSAALSCRSREEWIGWSQDQHFRRLRFLTNNQRFCVLPSGRRPNLASAVLSRTLGRLSGDFGARWGHPVVVVETFVDPTRHRGTCYSAGGFVALGETSGYGRNGWSWHRHGKPKLAFAKTLRPDARRILTATFDHPALFGPQRRPMLDLESLDFDGAGGLRSALASIADHRKRRGVRHDLASILAMATVATLAGARSVLAIGEHAADLPQEVLARLGAKFHPTKRRYIAPHPETFRRALGAVDTEALDRVVGAWLAEQVRAGRLGEQELVLALDGKSLRGATRSDGRAVHLFSAMAHGSGVVVGQREVEEDSNEISAFIPLVSGLDLDGALVTADAIHTQRSHARYLVEDKRADYLFQVKENQPRLLASIKAIPTESFSPDHEDTTRGHGRTEHRHVKVAAATAAIDFPHAAQVIVVYRERADLDDAMTSAETSYYITSIAESRAGAERLGRHVREHWGIENKLHWVRDWAFDEDRHQLRATSSTARAMATLRNLAISLLRLAGATSIAAALRWVARDPARGVALIGA